MPAVYRLLSDDNQPVDAHLELVGNDLVFHSRGGTTGTTNARNSEYSRGLLLLIERLKAAKLTIEGVWVDSLRTRDIAEEQRKILGITDIHLDAERTAKLLAERMRVVGQQKGQRGGNSTKRIRIKLAGDTPKEILQDVLNIEVAYKDSRALRRLPARELKKVTAEHIWNAIEMLIDGSAEHRFGESTDYDVLVGDGIRLPPKAVFGLAATAALGYEVLPENFSAGLSQPCFRILRQCGYEIVAKESSFGGNTPPMDREWREGKERAVTHLKKERAPGLSHAKKAQFKRENGGNLICERCNFDPVSKYGPDLGDACIEVHHRRVQVKDMGMEHRTRLEDLECLCANCHRIAHRELKIADPGRFFENQPEL